MVPGPGAVRDQLLAPHELAGREGFRLDCTALRETRDTMGYTLAGQLGQRRIGAGRSRSSQDS
jgi:hypothetical protein